MESQTSEPKSAPKKPLSETVAINQIQAILKKLPNPRARSRVAEFVLQSANEELYESQKVNGQVAFGTGRA